MITPMIIIKLYKKYVCRKDKVNIFFLRKTRLQISNTTDNLCDFL